MEQLLQIAKVKKITPEAILNNILSEHILNLITAELAKGTKSNLALKKSQGSQDHGITLSDCQAGKGFEFEEGEKSMEDLITVFIDEDTLTAEEKEAL